MHYKVVMGILVEMHLNCVPLLQYTMQQTVLFSLSRNFLILDLFLVRRLNSILPSALLLLQDLKHTTLFLKSAHPLHSHTSCLIIAYLASTILLPSLKLSKALPSASRHMNISVTLSKIILKVLQQRHVGSESSGNQETYQSTVTYLTPTFLASISF
jgi:hypothetical protein